MKKEAVEGAARNGSVSAAQGGQRSQLARMGGLHHNALRRCWGKPLDAE